MSDKLELPQSDFWDFTLGVYGRPGFSQAAIALQDRRGLDVNLMIFCLWAGSRGKALSADDIAALNAAVRPWRDHVVEPLRAVRRWLKDQDLVPVEQAAALGKAVLAREIEGEGIAQRHLEATVDVGSGAASAEAAAGNLMAYASGQGAGAGELDSADLTVLLMAAYQDLDEATAQSLLNG